MQTLRSSSRVRNSNLSNLAPIGIVFLLMLGSAIAQTDPGMAAAMQAQQATMQAQQAAAQAQQQASDAAMQANQAALNASQNSTAVVVYTAAPKFSRPAGNVTAGTQISLKSRTHYATIYYTTNGWKPTTKSKRYTGPITLTRTTQLKAIAIAPNSGQSLVASAIYTVPGTTAFNDPTPLDTDGLLRAGTRLHFVTDATINSKTAKVGDPLQLRLMQDVKIGDSVVVPKGTVVEARITQADPSGHAGTPGDLSFEVHALTVDGKQIPLTGGETLEGRNHYGRNGLILIPVVGVASLAFHGDEAQITPGMRLSASVAEDTPLQP